MAEFEWTRPARNVAAGIPSQWSRRLAARLTDWEDWLTLMLLLGATLSVALGLEQSGWSDEMPPITLVSILAIVASFFIARSGLSMFAAWPLAVLTGTLVVFWQTLELVGPGNLEQRLDVLYLRFETWFDLAFYGGVSNDSLPFNVLVLGLTWLGVFAFGWSVYRWQNAWIGLIPGGIALFVDMALVGDSLEGSVLLYMLFGFLLVMRTNLMTRMAVWRRDGTPYPSLISLSFLNFSTWALLFLIVAAWIAPVGPFATPSPVDAMVNQIEEAGVNFVRLSGPLHVKRVVPVHNFTGVLPFQGSIDLGDRELLTVQVHDPAVSGEIRLRGAVYEEYGGGGWKAGERTSIDLPSHLEDGVNAEIASGEIKGKTIELTITVDRNSVVGSVLFSPGEPVASNSEFTVEAPSSGLSTVPVKFENGGEGLSDSEILSRTRDQLGNDFVGLTVDRDEHGGQVRVTGLSLNGGSLPDSLVAKPPSRLSEGRSYNITGFIPIVSPEELRQANADDPKWLRDQYTQLPDLPPRIRALAADYAARGTNRYDKAVLIQDYLRTFPVEFSVPDTPPGRDAVDYFLFDSQKGYFDYNASAMTVMLRTLNIPARLAVGFVIGDEDKNLESGAYTIRDFNSYAWTEVYFPGYGWIAFNPSTGRSEALNPVVASADEQPKKAAGYEDLNVGAGADAIIEHAPEDIPVAPPAATVQTGKDYNPLLTLGVAAFIALLTGSVFLGWQRSVAGLPYSQQLWEKTVRLASWAGHGPRTGQTPAEFARSLQRSVREAEDVDVLAVAYNRSRFGKREPDDQKERLAEIWSPLRNALLGAIVGRITRRRRAPKRD
jgi:transglutaminase-like putative cysteine protease